MYQTLGYYVETTDEPCYLVAALLTMSAIAVESDSSSGTSTGHSVPCNSTELSQKINNGKFKIQILGRSYITLNREPMKHIDFERLY